MFNLFEGGAEYFGDQILCSVDYLGSNWNTNVCLYGHYVCCITGRWPHHKDVYVENELLEW